jgi:hypothetical protein
MARSQTGKTRITIRLDNEVLDWFRSRVEEKGEGNYQTMINNALRDYVTGGGESLETLLRRVIREELGRKGPGRREPRGKEPGREEPPLDASSIPRGRL